MDSLIYRRLITNLTKCSIIRVDLRVLDGRLKWNPLRKYTTQTIAHSTHIPPKIQLEVEPSALYVNPICMQLDQLMYNCTNHEELLNLLVTHRVMKILRSYVEAEDKNEYRPDCDDLYLGYKRIFKKEAEKNEVAVDLSSFTESEKDVIRKAESELVSHFQDPRNVEYVKDLYVNKNKLDVISICNVIMTLDALDHRYYRLYNGLLKRLLSMDITFEDKTASFLSKVGILLLKTCQCYARSGFNDVPLYNKVTRELIRNNLVTMMTNTSEDWQEEQHIERHNEQHKQQHNEQHKQQHKEQQELLTHIIRLYSQVKSYDYTVFSKISQTIDKVNLTPRELSCLAVMFSNHMNMNKMHDRVMYHVAERISDDNESFTLSELCSCISSFSKMKLYFGKVWRVSTDRLIEAIEVSINGYEDIEIDVKTLCKAVHDITTTESAASRIHRLLDRVSLYLEQRIDEIDEQSAINIAISAVITHASINERIDIDEEKDVIYESPKLVIKNVYDDDDIIDTIATTTSGCGSTGTGNSNSGICDGDLEAHNIDNMSKLNNYLLSYVWRKIGSDVEWEREPLKVFAIWLYHMLVLPKFKHNINKRCIFPSFRQWLLVYNTRHEIRNEVSNVIKNLYSKYKIYTKNDKVDSYNELLETPVPVDMLVVDEKYGNKVINIVESAVRNENNRATGVDLVIKGILEHYGLEVHFIEAHQWMNMDDTSRMAVVESIIRNEIN